MPDKHSPNQPGQPADKSTPDRVRDGLDAARHRATDAFAHGRDAAGGAAQRAAGQLDTNPLAVLAGGLAVGAVVGALIPRSAKEKELLAPLGRRLGETARDAIQAAREAGYAELDQRGLTKDAAKDQVRGLVAGLGKAVSSAGAAAAKTTTGHAES